MSTSWAWSEEHLAPLVEFLFDTLQRHPAGLREYELLQHVREARLDGFPDSPLSDPLSLFRSHFLLRHALYRLRERCIDEASDIVEMDALLIRLKPYRQGSAAITARDPLREYYYDLSHLDKTDAAEVEQLLTGFWQQLAGAERRAAALQVLGLEDPATPDAVQRQYRRLAMRFHPDRGGEAGRFQALQEAYEVLQTTTPTLPDSSST